MAETPQNELKASDLKPGAGLGIASMVLGIIGIVMFWVPFLNLILSAMAVIFGAVGIKTQGKGMAIAGLVMGLVVGVPVLLFSLFFLLIGFVGAIVG